MSGRGLGLRLFVGQLLVGAVGAVTLWVVAVVVGPPLFRSHLGEAGPDLPPAVAHHAEKAFGAATTVSFLAALLVGAAASVAVSLYLTRRLARSVGQVAAAAVELAGGRYDVRIDDPGLGEELSALTQAFNEMAGRLRDTEQTRRRLLGDLAHELRTPLAVLDAYLEGIHDGVATTDPRTLAMLRGQTARLSRLADDVADVSRVEEGQLALELQPTDLSAVCAIAVRTAQQAYAAKGVVLSLEAEPVLVEGDPQRLGQVLGNLLDNALRHTPAGGRVSVRCFRDGRFAVAEVADTGEGIPGDQLVHVFERFHRVDPSRDRSHGGSGIGLAIVRALVEAHGGRVEARSGGPGHGATFRVQLPATRGAGR